MTEHEVFVVRRRLGAAARGRFAVGAADANPQHAKFDLIRLGDRRFRPIDQAEGPRSRNNGKRFHICDRTCFTMPLVVLEGRTAPSLVRSRLQYSMPSRRWQR